MPQHLILTGGIYLDTILTVPKFPEEDAKQRASRLEVRFGGNCANSIRVLQSILRDEDDVKIHLLSCLPAKTSPATQDFIASFGNRTGKLSFESCIYREDHTQLASSYIIRSEQTGSRTIVNHNDLLDMTVTEFEVRLELFAALNELVWWHFEGRIPDTIQTCIEKIRYRAPWHKISVEVEKPGRNGLPALAAMADCVFYSRSWAESRGHRSPEDCLKKESSLYASSTFCTWGAGGAAALDNCSKPYLARETPDPVQVVDAVGAGDTFIAGILFGMLCHEADWDTAAKLRYGVELATAKVQRHAFNLFEVI